MQSFESRLIAAVKRKRKAAGLSIRALSSEVGVSFSSLARIERGEGEPDNNTRIRLLEWLGSDAEREGLVFDRVVLVHFRASKNVQSATVKSLLRAAECIKEKLGPEERTLEPLTAGDEGPIPHYSKDELERMAEDFRKDLGLKADEALDSLKVNVEGVTVTGVSHTPCLDRATVSRLTGNSCDEWSAMSVPLNAVCDKWTILLNDCHTPERQRVTVLEEFWHILLEHKLTKVARIADSYGRTYDPIEEHDAYYLASASLLPKGAIFEAVAKGKSSKEIAQIFGTSPELADYRLKRLGLWKAHVKKRVELTT